jgi:uncharacterized membrane protein
VKGNTNNKFSAVCEIIEKSLTIILFSRNFIYLLSGLFIKNIISPVVIALSPLSILPIAIVAVPNIFLDFTMVASIPEAAPEYSFGVRKEK